MRSGTPEKYLEKIIAIIDNEYSYISDNKGVREDPRDYGPCVTIRIDYDVCHEIMKEWNEIQDLLKKVRK